MIKRGRPTRIDAKLTRQFCELFREGLSITTTCAALEVSESKFHEWMKKAEQGEQPYAEFRQRTLCARAWGKIAHLRAIFANKDWRGRAWFLERTNPREFGRTVERPLPAEPEKERKISVAFVLPENFDPSCLNFPVAGDLSPPTPTSEPEQVAANSVTQRRPIVVNGRCVGWQDATNEDDAEQASSVHGAP